jgi:hypothetical protein
VSRRVVLGSAALLLAALVLWGTRWALLRFRDPGAEQVQLPLRGGGVSLSWAPARTDDSGSSPEERRDFLLESDKLRLVIGNDAASMERHQRYGALLDFGLKKDLPDELTELRTVLYVGGTQVPLRMLGVDASKAGERPVLAVEESSRDGRFELRTEYRLAPGRDYLELSTVITNLNDKKVGGVQVGDRGRWPGTPAFAPRLGHVQLATRADVPWIGRQGPKLTYGLVFTDRPAHAAFQFDVVGPTGEVTLGATTELPPHGSAEHRRDLIVVEEGLGRVAQIAWQRLGRPVGFARGTLIRSQKWANISARHPDGRTVLSVGVSPDGSYELPLPAGEYRFVLQAPGGEDEELARVVEGAELKLNLVPPRPGTLSYLLTDVEQQPLPGRLVIRGVPPTKDPELLPGEGEAGSKNILYTLTGAGAVELPAGRYDVLASHGPEYSLPRQELEVSADAGATFRAELSRVVDTSGYLSADFHLHASPSKDSNVPLSDRVLTLAAEGVELAVATDHNHVTDYGEPIRKQRLEGKLAALSGVEITTPSWGHFNAFPYPGSVELPPFQDASPLEIFAVVRARAPHAVLQVNHPRMPGVGYFNRGELDTKTGVAEAPEFSFAFDALEVSNGFDLEDPKVLERNLREWFELMNVGHRYTAVGNSDSHRVVMQWAGWPRTYVRVPDREAGHVAPLELARALTAGHALVSCGIFVLPVANGSAGPGDTVQGTRVSLAISARAPEWVDVSRLEVYVNGARVEERKREPSVRNTPWNLELDLELKSDAAVVVLARGDRFMNDALPGKWIKPFGFANPIFVDADGDGVVKPPGE